MHTVNYLIKIVFIHIDTFIYVQNTLASFIYENRIFCTLLNSLFWIWKSFELVTVEIFVKRLDHILRHSLRDRQKGCVCDPGNKLDGKRCEYAQLHCTDGGQQVIPGMYLGGGVAAANTDRRDAFIGKGGRVTGVDSLVNCGLISCFPADLFRHVNQILTPRSQQWY